MENRICFSNFKVSAKSLGQQLVQPFLRSIVIFAVLFSLSATAQRSNFRGLNHDGIYAETNLLDKWNDQGPELLTTISGIGVGYCSPAIAEDAIYVAGMVDSLGYLYRFDHKGKMIWKVSYGTEWDYKYLGSRSSPVIEKNRVYYTGTNGDVICVESKDGKVIWQVNIFEKFKGSNIKWGYTESPLIYKDLIFLTPGGETQNIVALNKLDGSLKYSINLGPSNNAYCSPGFIEHNNKKLVSMSTSNKILFFDPENGDIHYSHKLSTPQNNHPTLPIYQNGTIFYSSGYGEGSVRYKFNDATKGLDTLYFNGDLDSNLSGIIMVDGIVYGVANKKKEWVGVEFETGKTMFQTKNPNPGSFIMADNKFYIFADNGNVYLAKPQKTSIEILSQFKIPVAEAVKFAFAFPVINNKKLYIRYLDNIWVYNVGK